MPPRAPRRAPRSAPRRARRRGAACRAFARQARSRSASHRAHGAIEGELTNEKRFGEVGLREHAVRGEDRERDRQIEPRPLFLGVRRRQVHQDFALRKVQRARVDRRLHAIAALAHRRIGETQDRRAGEAAIEEDLDEDQLRVRSADGGREHARPMDHSKSRARDGASRAPRGARDRFEPNDRDARVAATAPPARRARRCSAPLAPGSAAGSARRRKPSHDQPARAPNRFINNAWNARAGRVSRQSIPRAARWLGNAVAAVRRPSPVPSPSTAVSTVKVSANRPSHLAKRSGSRSASAGLHRHVEMDRPSGHRLDRAHARVDPRRARRAESKDSVVVGLERHAHRDARAERHDRLLEVGDARRAGLDHPRGDRELGDRTQTIAIDGKERPHQRLGAARREDPDPG